MTFLVGLGEAIIGLVLVIAHWRLVSRARSMRSRVEQAKSQWDKEQPEIPITDHLAQPGPLYWDYRCLVCSHDVAVHSFWGYVKARLRGQKKKK